MKPGIWYQIQQYLFIKKKDPNSPRNINTSLMHGMNRISIFIFLIAIVVMIVRMIAKHH